MPRKSSEINPNEQKAKLAEKLSKIKSESSLRLAKKANLNKIPTTKQPFTKNVSRE